ncbi:UDP-N-acetylglucosamine transferase subunit ALG14-like isoform X2 [Populus alba x Populus x berolinensis]|nr:UDP-N-acetylglucosamine transferase subunit ALG14-like isoform X2 [Populus alba x Populus x berolinensis]
MCAVFESLQYFLHKNYDRQGAEGARGSLCNSCKSTEEAGKSVAGIIGHLFFMPRIARLKKLSLSGLLLFKLCIADQFFVQWRHNYRENILKFTMLAVSCV